ncbi:hypothetical protein [Klebsiella aerogenes]|uniref:hypothetical protein n=1 Tax=Klebsiella aerogenes TaxID=548 RepID=UPI001F23B79B|nr:hypothetical protein [Klebsiella aerogenes]
MNEQANKILVELLQKAANGIDAAVSFSQAQLPDVVEQLMHWKMASYSLQILTCLLIIVAMVFLFKKSCKWFKDYKKEGFGILGMIASPIVSAPCAIIFFISTGNLIQLWIAPKIWLIEYAACLVK